MPVSGGHTSLFSGKTAGISEAIQPVLSGRARAVSDPADSAIDGSTLVDEEAIGVQMVDGSAERERLDSGMAEERVPHSQVKREKGFRRRVMKPFRWVKARISGLRGGRAGDGVLGVVCIFGLR